MILYISLFNVSKNEYSNDRIIETILSISDYLHVQFLVLHPKRRFKSLETRKSESKGAIYRLQCHYTSDTIALVSIKTRVCVEYIHSNIESKTNNLNNEAMYILLLALNPT